MYEAVQIQSKCLKYPGYLFVPNKPGPHPGIILLHGSDGGTGDFWQLPDEPPLPRGTQSYTAALAKKYAELGFSAYALSYFHFEEEGFAETVPEELSQVNLINVVEAMKWFKQSSFVAENRVGLWAGSRGAELALILASREELAGEFNEVFAFLISSSPPDFICPGLTKSAVFNLSKGKEPVEELPPAWSLGNRPLKTYTPIEVEKIQVPLIVTYFETDFVWGEKVKISNFKNSFTTSNRNFLELSFDYDKDVKQISEVIRSQCLNGQEKTKAIFIKYLDTGHCGLVGSKYEQLELFMLPMIFELVNNLN